MSYPVITNNLKERVKHHGLSLDDVIWAYNNPDKKDIPMGNGIYKCVRTT